MFEKKINYDEKLAVIVAKYNKLALFTTKAQSLLDAFNQRYRSALASKRDLKLFLDEEEQFLESLLLKEEAQKKANEERAKRKSEHPSILEEQTMKMEKAIAKYEPLILANSTNDELMRLYGAIDELDRKYWSSISKFLREVFPLRAKSPLEMIENQLWAMVSGQAGKPPQALAYYDDCIRRGEAQKIDDASFGALKEAAFFLNDLIDLLKGVNFPEEEPAFVFLHGIISDFRIRDIKRKKE